MAKKNPKNLERRAMVEQMRQDQARKERQRSLLILGACVVVVVGLLAAALVPYIKDKKHASTIQSSALKKIGVPKAEAACSPIKTKAPTGVEASGANGNHTEIGAKINYGDAPPAFGQHWPNFLQATEQRNFWTVDDRPDLERMVHSLEHGHTYLWYDDTITKGSKEYQDLEDIATKFSDNLYFNVVPWKKTDGAAFPDGKHVALTHWTSDGKKQEGVWQYCGKPSGEVVASFVKDYPASNAPEPGAP